MFSKQREIRGVYDKFPDFFVWAFKIVVDSWKFSMFCYTSYKMTDQLLWFQVQMNSYSSKWNTPTTKAWLSYLVNFKNAILMWRQFRRAVCNKILFYTWKKCHRNVMECFRLLLEHLAWIEHQILSGIRTSRRQRVCEGWEVWEE